MVSSLLVGICAVAAPLDPPAPEAVIEARRIVQDMSKNERGPYSRIRWFCNDGSVQPPVPYACSERGGGRQHAEYSPQRQRLAELGWSVGTIFAALTYDELVAGQRQQPLRELPLERYLTDIDDGWVLRQARNYRGRLQMENEQETGKQLLLRLLSDAKWAEENFLLVREASRVIPHGDDTDLARTVRRNAIQLAELNPAAERWRAEIHADPDSATAGRLRRWAATHARSAFLFELPIERRLALVDAMRELDSEVQLAYQDMNAALTRAETLALSKSLLDCAYASGLLSAGELETVAAYLGVDNEAGVTLDAYRNAVARLKRAPGWAIGTIRHTFAEALLRYTALDPRAARFSDDLLRGSPMWMLGDTLKTLSKDVDYLSGSVVEIDGQAVGAAVALNSGIARGTLRIFDTIEVLEGATLNRSDIAVIPETIAELSPVAGILTLGEGNALSHVQLLARNLGIPNVAIDYDAIALLEALKGRRVLMIVTSSGDVLLPADDSEVDAPVAAGGRNIVVPMPDLSAQSLLVLDEVGREMSGNIIGRKAANLGELNRLFPGRVAPAIAVPFGIYAEHLDAAGLSAGVVAAFAGSSDGTLDDAAFNADIAGIRRDIAALRLSKDVSDDLVTQMEQQFGEPGSYGVFVRSDTNVEDLPQFTGAGLNETLPNIVEFEAQLDAVPRVWSSVFSPRALAWRSSVLANPDCAGSRVSSWRR